jgi:predicted NAD-dependent protein-ADP-ribosyltransferase YbiA (DUF1768 family)
VIGSVSYPTVVRAYWALATADLAFSEQIRVACRPCDAEKIAGQAAVRADWPLMRLAVMARLLRGQFAQHPALAEVLLATGDGRIEYASVGSLYRNAERSLGRNWTGTAARTDPVRDCRRAFIGGEVIRSRGQPQRQPQRVIPVQQPFIQAAVTVR